MHMRLGTMTSLFRDRRECAEHFGYIESIQRCRKAGFTVLDMNLCALNRRQTTLHLDNWQEQVDEIRNEAERLGCVFSQSHPPLSPRPRGHLRHRRRGSVFPRHVAARP